LDDKDLPEGVDALYFGGGYPEEFAQELSRNTSMMDSIRQFAQSGKPIYGECGGLMYLSQGIESRDGKRHSLTGLLPVWTKMLDRLKSLGYVEVTLADDSLFGRRGAVLRGHEFHYSELLGDPCETGGWTPVYGVRHRRSDAETPEGFQNGNVLLSYVHLHFASRSDAVRHFVSVCAHASNL
jgi:cobyrinic acid a,c-diamide synthase